MKDWEIFNSNFKNFCIENLKLKLGGITKIYEICVYPFTTGGKFFRPYLLYKVSEFLLGKTSSNVDLKNFLPFALAIELIHNYSLIHDDLPSMDNSDLRRGYPTVHKKFGEAEAILAGDMLLTLAFEFISSNRNFDPQKILAVIRKVSQYSSYRYLVTGQYYDIWLQKGLLPKNLQNVRITNFYKTAGLILLAVEIPIILLNPFYSVKYDLIKYGYFLGLLFQITDDMLDNDGLAQILDLEELKKLAQKFYEKTVNLNINQDLKDIAKFVYTRKK